MTWWLWLLLGMIAGAAIYHVALAIYWHRTWSN
jgi:hypothetical protein